MKDEPLKEYTLYWRAQVERVQGKERPRSRTSKRFAAIIPIPPSRAGCGSASGHCIESPEAAGSSAALDAIPILRRSPAAVQRAHACQEMGALARAAKDYQAVYYRFALSDEARSQVRFLRNWPSACAEDTPPAAEQQETRAQRFLTRTSGGKRAPSLRSC